jgi:hypothetical protein
VLGKIVLQLLPLSIRLPFVQCDESVGGLVAA